MKSKIFYVLMTVMVFILIAAGLFVYDNLQKDSAPTQGYYDNNNNLFNGNLGSLAENTRGVTLVVYQNNQPVFSQLVLGYIYSEKYVVVPYAVFYVPGYMGRVDVLAIEEVNIKLFLGPNPDKEDDWKKEELGKIRFKNENIGFAIVERIDPIFDVPESFYTVGSYDKLELGDFLYLTGQENGALIIKDSMVSRLFSEGGKNLISVPGNFLFQEWGGLAFVLRGGKPELVGMFCVIGEPVADAEGIVFIYFLDITQIIGEIEILK